MDVKIVLLTAPALLQQIRETRKAKKSPQKNVESLADVPRIGVGLNSR
jgi:hypothetical protein